MLKHYTLPYDMRGGAHEYVMGNFNGDIASSDFNDNLSKVEDKYIDIYMDYESNIYGDAIYETSEEDSGTTSWDEASSSFVINTYSWFLRGGHCQSSNSGVFSFYCSSGGRGDSRTFRPVVVRSVGKK